MKSKKATVKPGQGRRRLDVDTGRDRESLLRRQQLAANALVVCYYGAAALSLIGLLEAVRRFSAPSANGDHATGLIIGMALLAGSVLWAGFTAFSAYGLRKAIAKHNIHSIRRRALAAVAFSLIGLVVLAIRAGSDVLASTSLGIIAVGLILMSIVALTAYSTNRFVDA